MVKVTERDVTECAYVKSRLSGDVIDLVPPSPYYHHHVVHTRPAPAVLRHPAHCAPSDDRGDPDRVQERIPKVRRGLSDDVDGKFTDGSP